MATVDEVEAKIREAVRVVSARGLSIQKSQFMRFGETGTLAGCCPLAAVLVSCDPTADTVATGIIAQRLHITDPALWAIVDGIDGNRSAVQDEWYACGRRLAAELLGGRA
jgi:hypothetical protein